MKKILFFFILFLIGCNDINYKYEINKEIFYQDSIFDAVWYVDTFEFDGDTLYYFNTDSTKVIIEPPFTIKELKKN